MYVRNLRLRNFRNYKEMETSFCSGLNVIYGQNGQGKTNIIEALFLCAAGKSHRTAHDVDLINTEADSFCIDLFFENGQGDRTMQFRYNQKKQKAISVQEIPLRKIGELMGNFNAVIFSPEDLMMIKQGPALRRRFIDIALSQIKPSYFYELQQYNKTLLQRNALLKQIKKNRDYMNTLEVWDQSLYQLGMEIIKQREQFLEEISILIEENHRFISGGKEQLVLKYAPSVTRETYLTKLKQSTAGDIERESTSVGPHRDDYIYLLNGEDLKIYGSQGQQRTAVLSSKLAELLIMEKDTGEKPVLLLDDVLSELDLERQKLLFEKIEEIQTFVTCTDKNIVKNGANSEICFYHIERGNLQKKEK